MPAKAETQSSLPWSDYLEGALGVLRWEPPIFWQSTPVEFWSAVTGMTRLNEGRNGAAGRSGKRLTQQDRRELEELMDQFPDKVVACA